MSQLTISVSGGLQLLQMLLELFIGVVVCQCGHWPPRERGWIVRSQIDWGRRTRHSFKTVRLMAISDGPKRTIPTSSGLVAISDGPKRTIPTSSGLELLQMLSESFIVGSVVIHCGQCVNVDIGPSRREGNGLGDPTSKTG